MAGKVHRGFKKGIDDVWPQLLKHINSLRKNNQKVWLTGHSLGAALATLAAARLEINHEIPVQGLYTFGQPRTGNREFAEIFDDTLPGRAYRFVNNTDLVTRLPPPKGYHHIGRKVYFTRKGKATNQLNKFQRFLDGLKAAVGDLGKLGPKNIKDHDMNMHVRRARKNIGIELTWQ